MSTNSEMWTRIDAALEEVLRVLATDELPTAERRHIARLAREMSRAMPENFLRYLDAIHAAAQHIDDVDTVEPLLDASEVLRPLDEDHVCSLNRMCNDACARGAAPALRASLLHIAGHAEHDGILGRPWMDLVCTPGALDDDALVTLALHWAKHRGVEHRLCQRLWPLVESVGERGGLGAEQLVALLRLRPSTSWWRLLAEQAASTTPPALREAVAIAADRAARASLEAAIEATSDPTRRVLRAWLASATYPPGSA